MCLTGGENGLQIDIRSLHVKTLVGQAVSFPEICDDHVCKRRNKCTMKEIIPWHCHVCGSQFGAFSGGICIVVPEIRTIV